MAGGAHVADTDHQEAKHQVENLDDPVIFPNQDRRLRHAETYHGYPDGYGDRGEDPTAASFNGLSDTDDPERAHRQKTQ